MTTKKRSSDRPTVYQLHREFKRVGVELQRAIQPLWLDQKLRQLVFAERQSRRWSSWRFEFEGRRVEVDVSDNKTKHHGVLNLFAKVSYYSEDGTWVSVLHAGPQGPVPYSVSFYVGGNTESAGRIRSGRVRDPGGDPESSSDDWLCWDTASVARDPESGEVILDVDLGVRALRLTEKCVSVVSIAANEAIEKWRDAEPKDLVLTPEEVIAELL